jgi:hypothetical protein
MTGGWCFSGLDLTLEPGAHALAGASFRSGLGADPGPGGAAQGGLDAAAGEAVGAAGVVGVEGRVGACSRGAQATLLLVCSIDNSLCK